MKIATLILTFIFCLFMSITAVSMGLGAAFPVINQVAQPFVCPDGKMTSETMSYHPYPGKMVMTRTWYCVNSQSQSRVPLSLLSLSLYAGIIYGLIFFIPLFILIMLKRWSRSEDMK